MKVWRRRRTPWADEVYLSVDLETTGLRPAVDEILSIGRVPIRGGTIRWGERDYAFVRSGVSMYTRPVSATILARPRK